jgi:hypothetical protein
MGDRFGASTDSTTVDVGRAHSTQPGVESAGNGRDSGGAPIDWNAGPLPVPPPGARTEGGNHYVDRDGDGRTDAVWQDTDGDGDIDRVGYDDDGDGKFDRVLLDRNGDGRVDLYAYDQDGDGHVDYLLGDENHDGHIDAEAVDTNDDGVVDTQYRDMDYDGDMETTIYWDPDTNPWAHM